MVENEELTEAEQKRKWNLELLDWLEFMENPNSERLCERMKENEELRMAKEKLDKLSADEEMQRLAELREKGLMGEKELYRLGEKRGMEQEKVIIARQMIKHNMDIDVIMEITGLTREEIEIN